MQVSQELIPVEDLIEEDEQYIRFKGLTDTHDGTPLVVPSSSVPFEHSNQPGGLRPVESIEEACELGQKMGMRLQAIFGKV